MNTCPSRFGFSQHCRLVAGHQGSHDSGRIRWSDSEAATSSNSIVKQMGDRTE